LSCKEWRRRNSILTITNKLLRGWPQKRLLVSSVMPRLLIIMVILRNKMRKRKRGEGNK